MNKTEFWSIMALGVAILASTNIQLLSLSARISDNTRAIAGNAVAIAENAVVIERAAAPLHKELSHVRVDIANLENRLIREVLNQRNELNDIARRLTELEGKEPN